MKHSFGECKLILFLLCVATTLCGQEICNNGIDDDGDALIDLNDADCICALAKVESLIPNPSFEDQNCCPSNRSMMNCADTWIQASEATTDYIHQCGWMGWPDFPPPQPFPDGVAVVGFRDGLARGPNSSEPNPNWKEYAGACLNGTLRAGVTYKFELWIGFASTANSPGIDITVYAAGECNSLPFGAGNDKFGCPSNDPRWDMLGSTYVSGSNEWIQVSITKVPTRDYNAIAIGPSCTEYLRDINPYYFFDNLVLATQSDFDYVISSEQHPCDSNFTLSIPQRSGSTYQWYRDGIAIVGATDFRLKKAVEEGNYQVRVVTDGQCEVLPVYKHRIPSFNQEVAVTICAQEIFPFKDQMLEENGLYQETFRDKNGCDSIVLLQLTVQTDQPQPVNMKIFSGSNVRLGSFDYSNPGQYLLQLQSSLGCDSLVDLSLSYYDIYFPNAFSPNNDGINDVFVISSEEADIKLLEFVVYNRWGQPLYEEDSRVEGFKNGWDGRLASRDIAIPGTYVYRANFMDNSGRELHHTGTILLID